MSAFAEFCLVALALFLWESILWIPLRGHCVSFGRGGKKLRIIEPGRWFSTKSSGAVFSSLVPGSAHEAPCQALPLVVDETGRWLLERDDGVYQNIEAPEWQDIHWRSPHLIVRGQSVRLTGKGVLSLLQEGKKIGLSPADAVRRVWRLSISLPRAAAAWRRWHAATAVLRWMQPTFCVGFVSGLVMYGLDGERFPLLLFLCWTWLMMWMIAGQLWHLGRKGYPESRGEIGMDVLLCLLIPFHAMRAAEIVARHGFGHVHPYAMVLRFDRGHPWLLRQLRQLAHPRPGRMEDEILRSAMRPWMEEAMLRMGGTMEELSSVPTTSAEDGETHFCPRCESLYLAGVDSCRECGGYPLVVLPTKG
jgi:hypothetical protein